MATLVVLYIVVILLDRAIFDVLEFIDLSYRSDATDWVLTVEYRRSWHRSFWVVDLVFLTAFMLEIVLRIVVGSTRYFRHPLFAIDATLVLGSFVLSLWVLPFLWLSDDNFDYETTRKFTSAYLSLFPTPHVRTHVPHADRKLCC